MDRPVWKFVRGSVRSGGCWFAVYALVIVALTVWGCSHFRHELQQEELSAVTFAIPTLRSERQAPGI